MCEFNRERESNESDFRARHDLNFLLHSGGRRHHRLISAFLNGPQRAEDKRGDRRQSTVPIERSPLDQFLARLDRRPIGAVAAEQHGDDRPSHRADLLDFLDGGLCAGA